MRFTFVESALFTLHAGKILDDGELAELQRFLLENPESGNVMPGCGGVRKIRVALTAGGKGKRGGGRVIYLVVLRAARIHLLDVYAKSENENIPAHLRKLIADWAQVLKEEQQ
jgi:hypothetical protein